MAEVHCQKRKKYKQISQIISTFHKQLKRNAGNQHYFSIEIYLIFYMFSFYFILKF